MPEKLYVHFDNSFRYETRVNFAVLGPFLPQSNSRKCLVFGTENFIFYRSNIIGIETEIFSRSLTGIYFSFYVENKLQTVFDILMQFG